MTPIVLAVGVGLLLGFGIGLWAGMRIHAERMVDARMAQELACDALPARITARAAAGAAAAHRRITDTKGQTA